METTMENTTTIAHKHLNAAIKAATAVVPKRHPKPILRNVRAAATAAGDVFVQATDFDTEIAVYLGDCTGGTVAETLIPAHIAAAIGKEKGPVAVGLRDNAIEAFGATVPVEDCREYPATPAPPANGEETLIPFAAVRLIDEHVSVATDDESSRYALGGVLFERFANGRTLHAVGTDGRRLHVVAADTPTGGPLVSESGGLNAIVQPAAIAAFRKAVEALAGSIVGKRGKAAAAFAESIPVALRSTADHLSMEWRADGVTVRVIGRCVQGRFPRWRDCFPSAAFDGVQVTVPMPAGVAQIKEAARVTSEQSKGVRLVVGKLTAQSAERGAYSADFVGHAPVTVKTHLDPRFWIDALEGAAALAGDAVTMFVGEPQSMVTFRGGVGLEPRDGGIGFAAVIAPLAAD